MFGLGQNRRFAEWLQTELDERGWSQSDCARASDLNRAVINKLLNGRCKPQPGTLISLARGFRIPVEAAYRAAGYLPSTNDTDEALEELIYAFKSLQSPQRKATALMLVKALLTEEESELRGGSKARD